MVKNKMCDYRKMYEACGYSSLVFRYLLAQNGWDSILFPVRPSTFDAGPILCGPSRLILRWIFRLKHSVLARGLSNLPLAANACG